MAANLTPEQLERLRQMQAMGGNSGWVPNFGVDEGNGMMLQSQYNTPGAQGQDAMTPELMNYIQFTQGQTDPGQKFNEYGTDGTFSREGTFRDPDDPKLLLAALAAMGGMAFGLPMMGFTEGLGATGLAGATSGAVGGAGGFIGEGALSGVGAWDAALAGATPGMGAAGATGAGALSAAGSGGAPMSSFGVLDPSIPFGATASSLGATGSGIGGLLGKYGGLAATALGALAGSQGQEQESSSTKKMDPRLDPYYFGGQGQQGLLPMAMGLLQQQNSPEKMAQWDKMSNIGMGLLSKPRVQYFGGR